MTSPMFKYIVSISESDATLYWVRFQVVTVLSMKMAVFGDVALCSLVDIDQCYRGVYCQKQPSSTFDCL
jgi:hypothetical protein